MKFPEFSSLQNCIAYLVAYHAPKFALKFHNKYKLNHVRLCGLDHLTETVVKSRAYINKFRQNVWLKIA